MGPAGGVTPLGRCVMGGRGLLIEDALAARALIHLPGLVGGRLCRPVPLPGPVAFPFPLSAPLSIPVHITCTLRLVSGFSTSKGSYTGVT